MRMVLLMALALGCGAGGNRSTLPSELVGKWQAAGGDPERGWTKMYDLRADGTFEMTGYPPIRVTGKWAVPERDGNRFRVVLTDQEMTVPPDTEGSHWDDEDGWAVLDGAGLEWQGSRFGRTEE